MFKPSGGLWLLGVNCAYAVIALFEHFVLQTGHLIELQVIWLIILASPLFIPRLANWLNMNTMWDITSMWRKKEIANKVNEDMKDDSNVVNFPEVKPIASPLKVVEPAINNKEPDYTIGINEAGNTVMRIKLDYGSVTLAMTREGVIDLIEDLAHTIRKDYCVDILPIVDPEDKQVH